MNLRFDPIEPTTLGNRREPSLDPETLDTARKILRDLEQEPQALLRYARQLDGLTPESPLVYTRDQLLRDFEALDGGTRDLLTRVHARIEGFAQRQRETLRDLECSIDGGRAGHRFVPHRVAGCYVPGGRFPLPSSLLMTVVPAKIAGVSRVWVASPRPCPLVRASAFLAGVDALVAVGGAQAVGAMALGIDPVPACDVIVGPGNRYVTAAKHLVRGRVAIDMLAGPSELLVLADSSADPDLIACDLLAQAEHDPDAWPVLVTTDASLVERVRECLALRLVDLPTQDIALAALANGGYLVVKSLESMIECSERVAAEHLQLMVQDASALAHRLTRYGALFVGSASGEVMGDYGAGPNHVLPTGGTAKTRGGLSVLDFLSLRTWLQLDADDPGYRTVIQDSADLAEKEGLTAHALSAKARVG